jgi:hypothetical protein
VSLTSHCGMGSGVMQRVVNKKQKTLRQEGEMMGHGVHSGVQLYMCGRRQCDNMFPQEKMYFCFNHPRNPAVESRS